MNKKLLFSLILSLSFIIQPVCNAWWPTVSFSRLASTAKSQATLVKKTISLHASQLTQKASLVGAALRNKAYGAMRTAKKYATRKAFAVLTTSAIVGFGLYKLWKRYKNKQAEENPAPNNTEAPSNEPTNQSDGESTHATNADQASGEPQAQQEPPLNADLIMDIRNNPNSEKTVIEDNEFRLRWIIRLHDVNFILQYRDGRGYSLLHLAAEHGSLNCFLRLSTLFQNPNIVSPQENLTPLHLAIQNNHLEIAKLLCEMENIDVNVPDQWGETPLHYVYKHGRISLVKKLLKKGARLDIADHEQTTPIHFASKYGHIQGLETITSPQARIENNQGYTPLHYAAKHGRLEALKLLYLKNPRLINNPDKCGNTPLHMAVKKEHSNVVQFLIENGANISATTVFRETPLHYACSQNPSPEIAALLIQHGANINAKDGSGNTPLHEAAQHGKAPAVRLLRTHGANVNVTNNEQNTPLHNATSAMTSNSTIAQELLQDENIIIDAKNSEGKTPLANAIERAEIFADDFVTIDALLEAGADLNNADNNGVARARYESEEFKQIKEGIQKACNAGDSFDLFGIANELLDENFIKHFIIQKLKSSFVESQETPIEEAQGSNVLEEILSHLNSVGIPAPTLKELGEGAVLYIINKINSLDAQTDTTNIERTLDEIGVKLLEKIFKKRERPKTKRPPVPQEISQQPQPSATSAQTFTPRPFDFGAGVGGDYEGEIEQEYNSQSSHEYQSDVDDFSDSISDHSDDEEFNTPFVEALFAAEQKPAATEENNGPAQITFKKAEKKAQEQKLADSSFKLFGPFKLFGYRLW